MKRIWKPGVALLLLAALCAAALSGCGEKAPSEEELAFAAADLDRVLERGTLRVGVTVYEPLDYHSEFGEWTGFDAVLARLFARSLDVEVEFVEIDWATRVETLKSGAIDCIWNGMTRTKALEKLIDCSAAYLFNREVIVLPVSQIGRYDAAEDCYHLLFAVEDGSTAQALAKELNLRTLVYGSQSEACDAVQKKQCEAAIVDDLFALQMTGAGKQYDKLCNAFFFGEEEFCVGLRKGSALTQKVNDFLAFYKKNGTIASLADRFGLNRALQPLETEGG